MTSSPPPPDAQLAPDSDTESKLPALIYDLSQQVQVAMENMLKMTKEIDQNSAEILEDIEKSKDSALQRKKNLEEEKEHFQKAAFAVLNMLNRDLN
ncbi:Hypothetical predicted protein [Olea europaea subsp. europaea]|uniref:Uncharacterized protein n=1 Tax=Olea europaea subsp. europaea TaxID=158383 RepID=A0A8S0SYL7_OLEEU|nr:Hypothetical predicted protein [Olea europaea subsp. europaea]